MSSIGHVSDMIRRSKENRELLNLRRERAKDIQTKYTSHLPDTTVEEFNKMNKKLKERETKEQYYIFKMKFIFFCIFVGIVLLLWVIFKIL